MKKVIILLLLISTFSVYGQDNYQSADNMLSTYKKDKSDGYSWRYRENKYDKTESEISKEKILSTIWVTDPLEQTQTILVFYADDIFKIGTRQSGVEITGKYIIQNGCVVLFDYDSDNEYYMSTGLGINKTNCTFQINSTHLIYRDCISLGNKNYYAVGSDQSNGTELVFKDIIVLIDSGTKVMNENMKFRDYPSVNGKLIRVYQYGEISTKEITSIKKGTIINLLAKTKKVETIDGVTSSWYFIKVYDGYEWYQYGWVFGGYFASYDQSKKKEYWNIVVEELKK